VPLGSGSQRIPRDAQPFNREVCPGKSDHASHLNRWGTRENHLKVRRIVSNIATPDVEKAKAFYEGVLGLKVLMDLGWIRTYGSSSTMTIQISVLSEGGAGTAVPDISIEVDDIEEALARAQRASIPIEYGPKTEPWGVRRFYVRDPFGKLINILQHE